MELGFFSFMCTKCLFIYLFILKVEAARNEMQLQTAQSYVWLNAAPTMSELRLLNATPESKHF